MTDEPWTQCATALADDDCDLDADGIPDFSGGYDRDSKLDLGYETTPPTIDDNVNALDNFIPLHFRLPEGIDPGIAQIRICDYDASDPMGVARGYRGTSYLLA